MKPLVACVEQKLCILETFHVHGNQIIFELDHLLFDLRRFDEFTNLDCA